MKCSVFFRILYLKNFSKSSVIFQLKFQVSFRHTKTLYTIFWHILIYYNTDLSHGFLSNWWWSITMTTLSSSDASLPAKTLWSTRVKDSLPLRWRSWRSRSSLKVRWSGFIPVWLRRYLESVLRWNCDFGVFSTGRHLVWLEDEVWNGKKLGCQSHMQQGQGHLMIYLKYFFWL